MKRSVCFLMIGAFVLGVSGCSYHVTWGKNGVKLSVTPNKKASSAKESSKMPSQSSIVKRYTKEELKQLTADLLAPYEQRGYTKEKSFTGTKAQYAKWEKIRLAQQLNMLTKLSQLSRLKEQAISSSIFAQLNMLRGL